MSLDARTTLARPDLAASWLEGVAPASRYAATRAMQARTPTAAIRATAGGASVQVDQLLFGEVFDVLEIVEGFAWGQARRDGYVGFVEMATLAPEVLVPTHWVRARSTFAFAAPSMKAPAFGPLGLNALVSIDAEEGNFAHAAAGGWIPRTHLIPITQVSDDSAAVAERLVETPYLWGGRDSSGLDCSGLVQQALIACGRACPRDSDQQAALGRPIGPADLRRGDLVFWPGHVGMMLDTARLIHANAFHMAVAVEPLSVATKRIAASNTGPPTAFRRLF